jgi:hypothetical protein
MDIREIRWECVELSRLAHGKDEWHTLVHAVTKFGLRRMLGTCRPIEEIFLPRTTLLQ